LVDEFLDELKLINFLLRIEEVSKVDISGAMRLILELNLGKVVLKVLFSFSIAGFGINEKEEVIVSV